MEPTTEISRRRAIGGGIVAGVIGGLVLMLIITLAEVERGHGFWIAMKGASAPFLHARALRPGFDGAAVMLGLVDHFLVSIIWGTLFGVLAFGLPRSATVLAGAFWGLFVWLVMCDAVLPVVGLGHMARSAPATSTVILHEVFGLAVAIAFLPFQRTGHVKRPPTASAPLPAW